MGIERVKKGACAKGHLEGEGDVDGKGSTSTKENVQANEELLLFAEKRIVELEASLESFKSKKRRLRDGESR